MQNSSYMILGAFALSALLAFSCSTAIEDIGPTEPIVRDTLPNVEAPTWNGPPILFQRRMASGSFRTYERPALSDKHITQFVGTDSQNGPSKLVISDYTDRTDNSFSISVASQVPHYRALRCTPDSKCVVYTSNQIYVVDTESSTVDSVAKDGPTAASTPEGTFWCSASSSTQQANTLVLERFDPNTLSRAELFRMPADTRGGRSFHVDEVRLREVDGATLLIGQLAYYLDLARGTPSHTFCYDLTHDTLLWAHKYPVRYREDFANYLEADQDQVFVKGHYQIVAYDIVSGRTNWTSIKQDSSKFYAASPLMVGGGMVYAYEDAAGLFGYDIRTGERRFYDETVQGTVHGIDPFGERYVVLSSRDRSLNIFDPRTREYDLTFYTPNPSGAAQFFMNSFDVDPERQLISASDYEFVYVFDVSGY